MPTVTLLDYSYQTLMLVAILALPSVITSALVGLLVGFLQAITQVSDSSVAQAAKLITTLIVLLITVRWIGHELVTFARQLFTNFPAIVH